MEVSTPINQSIYVQEVQVSKLFEEEQGVLDALLAEWYEEIKSFTQSADGIFSAKGKMYDRTSPVWERIRFPHGFVQELRKKTDRVDQLLEGYETGEVTWDDVLEELGDILNYSRMFGALISMYLYRKDEPTPIRLPPDGEIYAGKTGVTGVVSQPTMPTDVELAGHPYLYQTGVTGPAHQPINAVAIELQKAQEAVMLEDLEQKLAAACKTNVADLIGQTERQPRDCLTDWAGAAKESDTVNPAKEYVDGDWVGTREKEKES